MGVGLNYMMKILFCLNQLTRLLIPTRNSWSYIGHDFAGSHCHIVNTSSGGLYG